MNASFSLRTAVATAIIASGTAWAQSPEEAGAEAIFNVITYGACPDDALSDHAAVQAAVDAAVAYIASSSSCVTDNPVRRAVIFFPKGTYRFDQSVSLSDLYGIDVRGTAHFSHAHIAGYTAGPALLQRTGSDPIFALNNCATTRFEHLIFEGSPDPSGTDPVAPLLEVHTTVGAASGLLQFKQVTFSNATIGVACTDSNNNSEFLFEHVNFESVGTCFKPASHQSLNHLFNLVTAWNCGTVFDLTRGGNVSVNIANIVSCNSDYIIKIGGGQFGGDGPNIGVSRFANVRIDSPNASFKLLWLRQWQKVEFDALCVQDMPGNRPSNICLIENGSVSFNACQFALTDVAQCIEGETASSSVRRAIRFRDCTFLSPIPLSNTPPIDACSLGIIDVPAALQAYTAYTFDKCDVWFYPDVFVPVPDCKHPTSGWAW